ncbi:hypothetical protein T492DRAFT_1101956 [Pavlovales sp. CCMP2436]|nr:hypothetical protein T492DRAFT_1101956 [Pavlovales sp. CCMP2436]
MRAPTAPACLVPGIAGMGSRLARAGLALALLGVVALLALFAGGREPQPARPGLILDRPRLGLPPTSCEHAAKVRGLPEVTSACNCSATSWCSLVCTCPGAALTASVWSSCDLSTCDHVGFIGGELVCRAGGGGSCGPRSRALLHPPAARADARAAAGSDGSGGAPNAPFAVGRVFQDAAELLWATPPHPGWCVRARTAGGVLLPLPEEPAAGGARGCQPPGEELEPLAASIVAQTSCVVGGLSAGVAYSFELLPDCKSAAASLPDSRADSALYRSEPALIGPVGSQCAALGDQRTLWKDGYLRSVNTCGKGCWGKSACAGTCMQKLGLSHGCASCWGEVVGCGAWNCWCALAPPLQYGSSPVLQPCVSKLGFFSVAHCHSAQEVRVRSVPAPDELQPLRVRACVRVCMCACVRVCVATLA